MRDKDRIKSIKFSAVELKILTLLLESENGLFGSELVHLSNGLIARGTVYLYLQKMFEKGLVSRFEVLASAHYMVDRIRYDATSQAIIRIKAFAEEFNFRWDPPKRSFE